MAQPFPKVDIEIITIPEPPLAPPTFEYGLHPPPPPPSPVLSSPDGLVIPVPKLISEPLVPTPDFPPIPPLP